MRSEQWGLPGVERFVAVASTPRTGSNLVCRALGATGQVPTPNEWMNPEAFRLVRNNWPAPYLLAHRRAVRVVGRTFGIRSMAALPRYSPAAIRRFLTSVYAQQRNAEGTVSLKVMWSHYASTMLDAGFDLRNLDVPVIWLRTTRRDHLAQAVSLARAMTTWQWTSDWKDSRGAAVYDADLIGHCLRTVSTGERGWTSYFADVGVEPLEIVYEELDVHYEQIMSDVFRHVGIDAPIPPRQIERQSDGLSAEWIERYRSERGFEPS